MESDFNKIVVVSLCDDFSRSVGKELSQRLGMMFCDTKDMVEYELIDKDALKKIATEEYLVESERKALEHIASFENVVEAINFDYLSHNKDIFKNHSLILFLKLTKTYVKNHGNVVDSIAYENRTKELMEFATLTISVQNIEIKYVCDKIEKAIGGIL